MSGSPTANRTRTSQSRRSVRHEARERAAAVRAAGAAAVPPAAAAPTPVSAATLPPPGQAVAPIATAPVVAALTTFEGQAVFRVLQPGTPDFRAGHLFRFRHSSRTVEGGRS
ncbi:hypothetical protein NOLU111490_13705 [Novosphingobium lubricantis]|uniref:hypothetical protein n=1 Tax=Novosphingobium sp. CCH12-A3 TaxID=1768752 RepID=UPI001E303BB1|nr:hypothetical protein [Novosphingobium sp. CCH12-A3]